MQLLMGYHNYYSDRRLIPEFGEDNIRQLEENFGLISDHPIINITLLLRTGRDQLEPQMVCVMKYLN